MKKQLLVICLIVVSCVFVNAQKPGVTTPTTQSEVRNEIDRERNVRQRLEEQRTRPSFPKGTGTGTSISAAVRRKRNLIKSIYRLPTDEELTAIAPSKEDADRFSGFLKQSHTGLFNLVSDKECSDNDKIVVAKPECQVYSLPGFGSAFSFRIENYRVPSVADLIYKDEKFKGGESLTQKMFVELGDVPLEKVNLQTNGVKFLTDFSAEADYKKFKEIADQLSTGIEKDGFRYNSASKVNDNSTYVLRSIAYEGVVIKFIEGAEYNELNWDKRKDIIVAFRVIRKNTGESVTVLWKQLRLQDAPKLTAR